ncbi:FAD-binding dehydrogenase [Mycobacterium sp. 236(2023)]|uniref:FAD-binding dehydrogenase n=1 Tax=Mycobacterium sp. 236(2023) TaxID=3038163 RepID=UPI00241590B0|nr:FAD-binding dehydrogenase [Mycobacterium sp. 236(2023)]MDG4663408.1 FAD-binding dehydrogenase [Mycobacterium sp. 236(2023)]
MTTKSADAIVVGHGLAGLVATCELVDTGKRVILVDQQGPADLGGQAYWSFGGLFMVDTPEQRRLGIKDSRDLAMGDWFSSAEFSDDRRDHWAREWASRYVDFASGEKRRWLRSLGWRPYPIPVWPERGGHGALGSGNSVPRFHVTWGTGPGLVDVFASRVQDAVARAMVTLLPWHRVDELVLDDGVVTGIRGTRLTPSAHQRGAPSSGTAAGEFTLAAPAVLLATGGVGGSPELVRELFTRSFGRYPDELLCGNPSYVDGKMIAVAKSAGAHVVNEDRLWFYPDGVKNIEPIWPNHGIHVTAGPSALWLDAEGTRFPPPLYPNFDTVGAVRHVVASGHSYSWLIMNREIFRREFGMSGQEQNAALTGKHVWKVVKGTLNPAISPHFQRFLDEGEDFVTATSIDALAAGMNRVPGVTPIDPQVLGRQIRARDAQSRNAYSKDLQFAAIRNARRYLPDRPRIAPPGPILDGSPLIAVKLHITTRKTLGGLQTDTDGRVLTAAGDPLAGLYAAGEVCGFGGGGIHGQRSLEGTFVGGCLFTGRVTGRSIASVS